MTSSTFLYLCCTIDVFSRTSCISAAHHRLYFTILVYMKRVKLCIALAVVQTLREVEGNTIKQIACVEIAYRAATIDFPPNGFENLASKHV